MQRSWVEIDETRLVENYRVVCEAAGAEVLAVVKANAYGHGLERCAVALAGAGGLIHKKQTWLGVADAAEGVKARRALRAAGILPKETGPSTAPLAARAATPGMTDSLNEQTEILVMCGVLRDEVSAVAEHGLTPVVWTKEQVEWLGETAHGCGVAMRVHVEIETGMGRQGVRPGAELDELMQSIAGARLELDGVMTHFSSAELAGSERTREQKRWFEKAVAQVLEAGLKPRWIHAGASSSVDAGENAAWLKGLAKSVGARAMVRSGIALYGYVLPVQRGESRIRARLKPVMTWKTRVLDVREVAAGEAIGYNATFTAKRPMRVALLPVGYSDGLRRELSGTDERAGGWVMVRGADGVMQRANIVGRVSMNLTTVDITGIFLQAAGGVAVGDEVVLLGDGVTADDHARIAGTISYEVLCGVRYHRVEADRAMRIETR